MIWRWLGMERAQIFHVLSFFKFWTDFKQFWKCQIRIYLWMMDNDLTTIFDPFIWMMQIICRWKGRKYVQLIHQNVLPNPAWFMNKLYTFNSIFCVVRKLITWNWQTRLFDSSWNVKDNETGVMLYHINCLCVRLRRSELKTIWFCTLYDRPKNQSFRTSLFMYCVHLCYVFLYCPTEFWNFFT
jgi:hypothetical protein